MAIPTLQSLCATVALQDWLSNPTFSFKEVPPEIISQVFTHFLHFKIDKKQLNDEFLERFSDVNFECNLHLSGWNVTNLGLQQLKNVVTTLTSLDISETACSKGIFKYVLRHFPNLRHFRSSLDFFEEDDRLLSLENLTSLGIVVSKNQQLGDLLKGLSIQFFSLKIAGNTIDNTFIPTLASYLKSMPNLRILSLEKANLQGDDFKLLLQSCQNVAELEIIRGRLSSDIALDYIERYAKQMKIVTVFSEKVCSNTFFKKFPKKDIPTEAPKFYDLRLAYLIDEEDGVAMDVDKVEGEEIVLTQDVVTQEMAPGIFENAQEAPLFFRAAM